MNIPTPRWPGGLCAEVAGPADEMPWLANTDPLSGLMPEGTVTSSGSAPCDAWAPGSEPRRRCEARIALLNGVLGDHLSHCHHPLAISLQLRHAGQVLQPLALGSALRRRVLLLVHDLAVGDEAWQHEGHDHGERLGVALDATVLRVRYNSGLPVAENGAALAAALHQMEQAWPLPLEALYVVGHGLGGLVMRAACWQGQRSGHDWLRRLRRLVFLGTPHLGLQSERVGHWLHRVLHALPVGLPFNRLSRQRSRGLHDLIQGRVLAGEGPRGRSSVTLPEGVACHAIAGRLPRAHAATADDDGWVPVASALGRHSLPEHDLGLPPEACWVGDGLTHQDLLSSALVYRRLLYAMADA